MVVTSLYMAKAELLAELELVVRLVVQLVQVLQEGVWLQGQQGWMRKIGVDHNNMRRDMKIPNKKQSMPLNPSSYLMPLSLLNEAIILLRTVKIEEICLCTLQHLLEETHHIAHSSPRTKEKDGTVANNSGKEEDKDNNDPNTTPPTCCDG